MIINGDLLRRYPEETITILKGSGSGMTEQKYIEVINQTLKGMQCTHIQSCNRIRHDSNHPN